MPFFKQVLFSGSLLFIALFLTACSQNKRCDDPLGCVNISPHEEIPVGVLYDFSGQTCPGTPQAYLELEDQLKSSTVFNHSFSLVPEDLYTSEQDNQVAASRIASNPQISFAIILSCPPNLKVQKILQDAGIFIWEISPGNNTSDIVAIIHQVFINSTFEQSDHTLLISRSSLQVNANANR